jgi:ADP-ribosyl-[dinitrogen reductase] hydrolase
MQWSDTLAGVILGTAVGDALGLPREGLTATRAERLYGSAPLSYRVVFGRGMVSDDTEHTCLVAQALLEAPKDVDSFSRAMGRGLRWWLAALPVGLGLGTLRAVCRLWLGFSPAKSGVFTAGNGPAMRAAIVGACKGPVISDIETFLRASTCITHTDPKAYEGALCIALAANEAARNKELQPEVLLAFLISQIQGEELLAALNKVRHHLQKQATVTELTRDLGVEGFVSGYINHTVPVALFCWLRNLRDFRAAIEAGIMAGGDADTVGAIVGALSGAYLGAAQIPTELLSGLFDWPNSVSRMRELSRRIALQFPEHGAPIRQKPLRLFWPFTVVRNLFFIPWVFLYGVRRLFPPY